MKLSRTFCLFYLTAAVGIGATHAESADIYLKSNLNDPASITQLKGTCKGKFTSSKDGAFFTGGGKGQRIVFPIINKFPVNNGTVEFSFKLNDPARVKPVVLFDVLGSPRWWDRFIFMVAPKKDNKLSLKYSISVTKNKQYAGREVVFDTDFDYSKWHHIAFSWKNINSGKPDVELKLYFDGVLVKERNAFAANIKNIAKKILLCGGNDPFAPGASDCISMKNLKIWSSVLPPTRIMQAAGNAGDMKIPERAFAAISPVAGKAPVVDGKAGSDEWSNYQTLGPFRILHGKGLLAEWQTYVNVAYDSNKLYVVWQALETGPPKGDAIARDGRLWAQDSIELVFSPNDKDIYHFIGNAYNSVFDELSRDGGKSFDPVWNGAWEYKSSFNAGSWTGELAIDYKKLGLKVPVAGTRWRFNVCRNGFRPQAQTMWNHGRNFKELSSLGTIEFGGRNTIVNKIDFGKIIAGSNDIGLSLNNPWKLNNPLDVSFYVRNASALEVSSQRTSPRRSNGTLDFSYYVPEAGTQQCLLQIKDNKSGKTLLSTPLYVAVKQPLMVKLNSDFYAGKVNIQIDADRIKKDFASGELRVLNKKSRMLFSREFKQRRINIEVPLKNIVPGEYAVEVCLKDSTGKTVVSRTDDFAVSGRPLYISKKAGTKNYTKIWGEPLKLQGQSVSCWNRKYTYNNTLFPVSMISNGGDVLAGSPYFRYVVGGIAHTLKSAKFKITGNTPEKITADVAAADKYLDIQGSITFEYDGIIIYKLNIVPKKQIVFDSLKLQFPLASASANYVFIGNELQFTRDYNIIGKKPGWKKGYKFEPMIGVGDSDRAMFWFCESDEGWKPYDRKDAITVKRTAKNVIFSLNILEKSSIKKALKMSCGFICSPFKPVKRRIDDLKEFHFWPGGPFYAAKNYNYERFNLKKAAGLGAKIIGLHEWWSKYYGGFEPFDPESLKKFVNHAHKLGLRVVLYRSAMENVAAPSMAYFGDHWLTYPVAGFSKYSGIARDAASTAVVRCPEGPEYIDWYVGSCRELVRQYGIDGFYYDFGVSPCINPLHGCGYEPEDNKYAYSRKRGEETATIGVDIMSDDCKYNNRRPTWPVLKHRELWRRMYNMIKEEKGDRGIISAHVSKPGNATYTTFVDSVLHSEHAACYLPDGKLPSLEQYRLFFSRAYTGLPGEVIALKKHKDTEALMSISMLHGEWSRPGTFGLSARFKDVDNRHTVNAWNALGKFGVDNAEWWPYWSKQPDASVSPVGKAYISYWKKPEGLLMVVSNPSGSAQTVRVSLKGAAAEFRQAIDAVNGKTLSTLNGGVLSLPLKAQSYKIILLKK